MLNKWLIALALLPLSAFAKTRVAVIDTGLNLSDPRYAPYLCESGHKDLTGEGFKDKIGHGTAMVSLILKNTNHKDFCLIIIKGFNGSNRPVNGKLNTLAFNYLLELKPDVVNFSGGGDEIDDELVVIKTLRNTIFIVAAGNDGANLTKNPFYPAAHQQPNEIVVGAVDKDGLKIPSSNYGYLNMSWVLGNNVLVDTPTPNISQYYSGTSVSTAIRTAQYLNSLKSVDN